MKFTFFSILFLVINFTSFSQDNIEIDSNTYTWFSPSLNYFQYFSKNSISSFYDVLNNSKKNKVSIIHFGDSHIQSEIPTNETRIHLQKKYGNGGRGIVFPYSTAKTYSSIHYSTKHVGNWVYAKSNKLTKEIPKGLMGLSSKTLDSSASFTITFNAKTPYNHLLLNLFCETDSLSYDVIVETDGNATPIDVYKNNQNTGFVSFTIPSISNAITFKCLKTANNQKQFIIHGFEILNPDNKGIVYYSSGVGGAKFNSLLNLENFNKQLKVISPDLVILDFGTNDFLFSDTIKETLEEDIKNVISSIRKTSPLISILLCTTQDLYYKQKNLNATLSYSELIKKIAKETEVAYWDWFSISGGKGALKLWQNQGLAKSDLIHLTNAGYRIKGKLLFEAIENTKKKIESNPNQSDLILTQKSRIIDVNNINIQNQNTISTLSSRELIDEDKLKKDSLNLLNFQNEILKQADSNALPTITVIQTNIDSSKVTNLDTTIVSNNIRIEKELIKSDSLQKNNTIDKPKTTSDILRTDNNIEQKNSEIIKTNQNKLIPTNPIKNSTNQNIKIEQFEDFNDSSLIIVEKNSKVQPKTKAPVKQNYELARERQHQILDHDTLAISIIKDTIVTIKKPIKKAAKPKNKVYKVRNGDNLSFIAEKHNVSVSDIKTWNRLKTDNLSIGQIIIIKK